MKRLFICEKPSLAEAVAEFLGSAEKKDGYYEVGNDYVAWLQGHILLQKCLMIITPILKNILMKLCQLYRSVGKICKSKR